ncbi:MAG: HipA domain-containing protein [Ignavibacteria bacterium]|nr:HipA domain-containing protein [Ignavibacteria bacterium]
MRPAPQELPSFSCKETRIVVLATAYDLVNTSILMPSDTEELALPLNGHKSKLNGKHFEGFTTMGLTSKQQEGILEKFSDKLKVWTEMVSASFLPGRA